MCFRNPEIMDEHWKPQILHCSACDVNYDHILKYEYLDLEEQKFHRKFGLDKILGHSRGNFNTNKVKNLNDEQLTKKYFDQLTDEEIVSLYLLYELDFKALNYSFWFRNLSFPN